METEQTPLIFKTSGNIIRELGRESISNQNIAILELLKNSYDASAKKVNLNFENINAQNPQIEISDDGLGMPYQDLINKWMTIASPHKRNQAPNNKREIIGQKGIGRLAAESIGNKAMLITKPLYEKNGFRIEFDWKKFEAKDVLIDQVPNRSWRFDKKPNEHGTTLRISELRQPWNDNQKLKTLLKDIYLLFPPNSKPKNFEINPNKGFASIDLKEPTKKLLDLAVYRLKARLTKNSLIRYSFYKGDKEPSTEMVTLEKPLTCGDATFELYFYYLSKAAYEKRSGRKITEKEFNDITDFIGEYNGIRLYRDNFQVKPFGDEGDWLGLEAYAQNNTISPRTAQIVGFIKISKAKNPEIIDTTTREGVIYSKEFEDLKNFAFTCITKLFINERSEAEADKKKARKTMKMAKETKKHKIKITPAYQAPVQETKIINKDGILDYPETFYRTLEAEINKCYEYNLPNATLFLWRKLIENLFFDILKKKYPKTSDLWYDSNNFQHQKLSILKKNLYNKRDDFKSESRTEIDKVNKLLGYAIKETNSAVHNIFEYLSDRKDLEKFKLEDIVQLLLNIYNSID